MVVFSGTALGKAFPSTEAEDPFDLCRKLALPSCEPFKDYRMWIEVLPTPDGDKFWFDVCLCLMSTDPYDIAIRTMWDGVGELNTIIQGAKERSPSSTPNEKPDIIDKTRKEQLKELKQMDDLFARVRYWVADMFDFESASARLGQRIKAQRRVLSPYYFSEVEARYLKRILVPGGSAISLEAYLNKLGEEEDNACASSHNLAPKMMRIFDIESNFDKDPSFQEKREAWIKSREALWRASPMMDLGMEHFE